MAAPARRGARRRAPLLLPLVVLVLGAPVPAPARAASQPAGAAGAGTGTGFASGRLHFAVAAAPSAHAFGRAFNRTLANVTGGRVSGGFGRFGYNFTLETMVVELPENGSFSSGLLENVCASFSGKKIVAVLIIGSSPAAFTVSLTAKHVGIPVLWARDQGSLSPGLRGLDGSPLEIRLAASGSEFVQALRGLLLYAHWHTYTILADAPTASELRRPELWTALRQAPLHPNLVPLSNPLRAQSLFRRLADISRSTRGVVVLLSDRRSAVRILDDARKLNMMDGHFVWIWIDTSSAISVGNASGEALKVERVRREAGVYEEDFDVGVEYLLRNDKYMLFNRVDERRSRRAMRDVGDFAYVGFGEVDRNKSDLPTGLLSLKPLPIKVDRHMVKGAVRLLVATLKLVLGRSPPWILQNLVTKKSLASCWRDNNRDDNGFAADYARELKAACADALVGKKFSQEIGVDKVDKSLVANFEILNLVPERSFSNFNRTETEFSASVSPETAIGQTKWRRVGLVSGRSVRLDTIVWPGGDLAVTARARTVFRVVTALAPPFVMESELDEDGQCLRGLPCHRVLTSDKDNLTLVFNEMQRLEDEVEEEDDSDSQYTDYNSFTSDYTDDEDRFFPFRKFKYRTNCCYGLSMDLLENIAQELEFDFRLYIVADGFFGSRTITHHKKRTRRDVGKKFLSYRFKEEITRGRKLNEQTSDESWADAKWNGIVGDLVSGAAHMSFAPLSVSSARSEVIDFSAPYFFSGVSFIAAPQQRSEIPLMAFLLPFSMELWIAIFTSLNITAIAVAIYEWLSPFGLNPWGRQRSKNFSMSSALWVMWGLLCGHLVAFKAPKSWPNKFLINVWGGFSVIFVASYTANIAALIAGLFFHNTVSNYHDRSLLTQKVGAPRSSAAEYYVQKANPLLWQHMRRYSLENIEEGVVMLRNNSLDILIADTPILDYYRATDHGCKLEKIGDTINEDTYAIGMAKGFPLKDSISAVIAKYSSNGYMDILQEKWYGGLPCFKLANDIAQPRPLGVAAVTGVFILLGLGIVLGLLILLVEHLFFRYTLPLLREKPKGSIWRSRNIMFFSQKLYRFINCVELVSPHHAARELVHTIRQGQITSLFQKSIKRKEHEQRRRRKSKAQFFEMIQEIRSNIRIRQQQAEEQQSHLEAVTEVEAENQLSPDDKKNKLSPSIIRRTFLRTSPKADKTNKSPNLFNKQLFSPNRRRGEKSRSSTALNVRRFSTDSVFNSQMLAADHSSLVGRRLSKDASSFLTSSPPDINSRRSSYLDIGNKLGGKSPILSIENISDCGSTKSAEPALRKLSDSESIGKKLATLPRQSTLDKHRLLQPQYSLTLGKSDEAISDRAKLAKVASAKSFNSLSVDNPSLDSKGNLSDDEIARRNKDTISQLQQQFTKRKAFSADNSKSVVATNPNPQIRIQVEDTTESDEQQQQQQKKQQPQTKQQSLSSGRHHPPLLRKTKTRHQSLGETNPPESSRRKRMHEQSKSLDSNPGTSASVIRREYRERSRSRSRHRDDELPPAPPPPNCSPRNSEGRSPLERLSKDELVRLWRSSESELRSHLLKAIRDKEEPSDPP